jgi:hypothetical protein
MTVRTARHAAGATLAASLLALTPLALLFAADSSPRVVDFEKATLVQAEEKAVRMEQWVENGVVFKLAREPKTTKAKGLIMFFAHIGTGRKGIVCAMATEPIPVRATFPVPVSAVTLRLWGSTGTAALVEAFDADGHIVDRTSLDAIPGRKAPEEQVPMFDMSVKGARIAYVEFSGPRDGEYLVADEVRFTPVEEGSSK